MPRKSVDTPVLFVQCTQPFLAEAPADWRAQPFEPGHAVRTVDAHHFSMIQEHSLLTAQAIQQWLDLNQGISSGS
jgi:hypothetical protein